MMPLTMSITLYTFILLFLVCVCLCGMFVLRLVSRARRQQRELAGLSEALRCSREHAEEQKTRLAERSDLDRVKDEFISTVSHELRTPLTSIRGALGLLSSGLLGNAGPRAQNLLRIASTNTERLIRLINDILDLERMESGRSPLILRRCSLRDLASEAIDSMTALADAAQVRLSLDCHAPLDSIYFDADPDRIQQVLTNLLSNAIKFSPQASTVTVEIDSDADRLILKVVDYGRGIPTDKLESVFDRFQQVEPADSSKKGGTGLGLAICRSIVLQHGGAIWAQPNQELKKPSHEFKKPNQDIKKPDQELKKPHRKGEPANPGTTFCVQFTRCARVGDIALPLPAARSTERGAGLILVCDDDPSMRAVVCEQLNRNGYDVIEAGSGEAAIAMAHGRAVERAAGRAAQNTGSTAISAILLDLYLPGLNGWVTLRQLKNSPVTAAIPVIILSVIPPAERSLLADKAQGWVQKPFSESLLMSELERVLKAGVGTAEIAQQSLHAIA